MNLLGAVNYDPVGGAVTKVTTSLIAMTALDTTNLRIAFTVPSHGMVHVRMQCAHHGGTTTSQLFLGCLEGSTLRGRMSPTSNLLGTAVATTRTKLEVAFTITGLTPGAVNWDAAYGVEIVSSAGGIKYGGPNDTTTDNAFGGFNFEIWDPRPFGVTQTAGDIVALINAVDDLVDTEVAAIKTETASIQSDTNDIQARLPAALTADGNIKADVLRVGGTLQTAGDIIGDTNDIQTNLSTALGYIDTEVAAILADTNELQTDWVNGGRLDLILDARASQTSVDDLPTNAELATSQAAADDATLAQIALVKTETDKIASIKAVTDALPNAGALTTIQADLDNIQTRLPAALSGDGFMKADVQSIDDELTNSNNAVLNLKQLNINNGAGHALIAQSTGGGGNGIWAIGNGTGTGIKAAGGANSPGIYALGGSTTGSGIEIESQSAAPSMQLVNSAGTGPGLYIEGGTYGIEISADTDDGILVQSLGGGKSINAPQDIAVSDGDLTLTAIANKVLASVIETGYTLKQSMRLILSALAGKLSGAATTTVTIRSATDAKDRIVATVDGDGNRTAVTHDVSD